MTLTNIFKSVCVFVWTVGENASKSMRFCNENALVCVYGIGVTIFFFSIVHLYGRNLPYMITSVRDRALEKLWGGGRGGRSTKNNSCKGKLRDKKIHAQRVAQTKFHSLTFQTFPIEDKKNSCKGFHRKKNNAWKI